MPESKASTNDRVEPESVDDPVLIRHLTGAHENPNVPRSVFAAEMDEVTVNDDEYMSFVDGSVKPGKGFSSKSVSVPAYQMKHAFDANGVSGNEGDYLVYFNNHWDVVRKEDMK